jgi:predicted dehydrogenase
LAGCSDEPGDSPGKIPPAEAPKRAAAASFPEGTPIRAGLVGCGGRGTVDATNFLKSGPDLKIVALADMFQDRLDTCRATLSKLEGCEVEDSRCFTGFDACSKLLDSGVDVVLLCEPPGFRPMHFEAAIEAGKSVFMEKPVAVDPVGVRRVIAAGEKADLKGLSVVAGTQTRHNPKAIETIRRIHEGQIGDVVAGRVYCNVGPLWEYPRKEGEDDMQWQIRNWYYFCWLCGDHIVEQHIHHIDVLNWVMRANPVKALAFGGRQVRVEKAVYGNIYDHFGVDYEYPNGIHALSMCRQWKGVPKRTGSWFYGTKGEASINEGTITGADPWTYAPSNAEVDPSVQEHADLVAALRKAKPLNEARRIAESTLAAIVGRQSAYTGQYVTWKEMMESKMDLSPPKYAFGPLEVRPVPMPGRSK